MRFLKRDDEIAVLGGKEYLEAVKGAFEGTGCVFVNPFEGLGIGERMRELGKAKVSEKTWF